MIKKKINALQLLRVIAVSLVIFIHAAYYGVPIVSKIDTVGNFYNLKSWGAIGVDLFFAISGFIMTIVAPAYTEDGKWKTFLIKRIIRIIPLYYIVSVFQACNLYYLKHLPIPMSSVLKTIIFFPIFDRKGMQTPILGIGWSLSYEMYFYLLVCLVLVFKRNIFRRLLTLITILSLLGYYINPNNTFLKFLLSPMLIEFGYGILVGLLFKKMTFDDYKIKFKLTKALVLQFVGLSLMCITIFIPPQYNIHSAFDIGNDNKIAFYRAVVWGLPCAIFMMGVILLESFSKIKIPNIFVLAGDASYSCYLVHLFILLVLARLFKHFNAPISFLVSVIPICLFLSILFYFLIEKKLTLLIDKLYQKKNK